MNGSGRLDNCPTGHRRHRRVVGLFDDSATQHHADPSLIVRVSAHCEIARVAE